tara:strand:+ start:1737 stop:2669 length:933 start_codon:yes stop_codon:yes gene_type:complete
MRIIDSHTGGEPTRLIVDSGLDLGTGSLADKARKLQKDHRNFCTSILSEPRGNDAFVGALLVESLDPSCVAGVIFFNTVQNLGMCGHGSIGVAATLSYLGRIQLGTHHFETPVGIVTVELKTQHLVSVTNVESFRLHKNVKVSTKNHGDLAGDVAWGGNWFFLLKECPISIIPENLRLLTSLGLEIRQALESQDITGSDGAWIDHIELYGPPQSVHANSRSFVLVPSGSYDRSPCGTGCSAKMACLASDEAWPPGKTWIQESLIGSTYLLTYEMSAGGGVDVTIEGEAFVMAEVQFIFEPNDPYRYGIPF